MADNKDLNKENEALVKETVSPENTAETAVKEKEAAAEVASPKFETEIKETAVSDTQVYEDEEEETEIVKPKKRFKKRFVIIPLLLVAGGAVAAKMFLFPTKTLPTVVTQPVELGNIENIISISGNVASAETQVIFADIDGTLSQVNVKVGDKVSAGDVLFTYDNEKLDLAEKQLELSTTKAKADYNSIYSTAGAADRKYAEGMSPQQINDRMDAITAECRALDDKITEKKNRINQTIKDLNNVSKDINQNGVFDGTLGDNNYYERRENDNNNSEMSESNRQMYLAVQQTINDVTYARDTDPEIKSWEDQKKLLEEEKAHLTNAKSAYINPSSATASKAGMESTLLSNEDKISRLEAAKEGVKADFDAVITAVDVAEGQSVQAGAKTITLANIEDVQVNVQVSKSDLGKISLGQKVDITVNNNSYEGEITKISGTATKNSNGVPVVDTVIKIKNPDQNIILGVEANNKIHAQKAENTVVLPYECILTDAQGDYVYVVENGIVTRKNVKIGISTSTQAQILEGLSAGDQVISTDLDTLTEGAEVQLTSGL
jgi:RND family efflux transporter MFP subunit